MKTSTIKPPVGQPASKTEGNASGTVRIKTDEKPTGNHVGKRVSIQIDWNSGRMKVVY